MPEPLCLYRLKLGEGAIARPAQQNRQGHIKALLFAILALNSRTVYIAVTPESVSLISANRWNKTSQSLLSYLWRTTKDKSVLVARLRVITTNEAHLTQGEQTLGNYPLTRRILWA